MFDPLASSIGHAGLTDPNLKARLADLGAILLAGSPADFKKHVAAEVEKWGKVDEGGQHQGGVVATAMQCSISSDTPKLIDGRQRLPTGSEA